MAHLRSGVERRHPVVGSDAGIGLAVLEQVLDDLQVALLAGQVERRGTILGLRVDEAAGRERKLGRGKKTRWGRRNESRESDLDATAPLHSTQIYLTEPVIKHQQLIILNRKMLSEKRSLSLNSLTENPTQGDYGAMEISVFFIRSQDGRKLWVMV